MVFFAIAHRYAFPHTDYIHYLRRHEKSSRKQRTGKSSTSSGAEDDTLFLFDQNQNAVNDPARNNTIDVEYEPPSVRQLDRPMSVTRALMGVVPNETFSDIARMGMSGSVVVGEGDSGRSGISQTRDTDGVSDRGDIVFSREHAEGI
mmetsp:Transcript_31011/g.39865  ORF Transcript_31011/g.39865 Transcript_31011/m.39865 type:complete len:147 (+) Transcript_31011:151-591(+)